MAHNQCILMFVKTPEKGAVKSRLAISVGNDIALDLYRCFVRDTLKMMAGTGYPYVVCFHPPDSRKRIVQWLGDTLELLPQTGDDLGERMKIAFLTAFSQDYRNVVLIGSDSPDLPGVLIDEAFTSLKDYDAVVGPSLDGGYYLIGFRADTFLPQAFDGMPWSTPEVFIQTLDILRKAGNRVHILPTWRDVDTLEDLKALVLRSPNTPSVKLATVRYIKNKKFDSL